MTPGETSGYSDELGLTDLGLAGPATRGQALAKDPAHLDGRR